MPLHRLSKYAVCLPTIRSSRASLAAVLLLTACQDQLPPSAPAAPEGRRLVAAQPGRAFYYYQGAPVYLDEDSSTLVVELAPGARIADLVRSTLAPAGLTLAGDRPLPYPAAHHVLQVRGGAVGAARQALGLLRAEGRVRFASVGYVVSGRGAPYRPINSFDVLFKDGVTTAQIDSVVRALGATVVRPPRPDSGFFAYRMRYPVGTTDPLTLVQTLYKSPLVQWADADRVGTWSPQYVPTDPFYGSQYYLKNASMLNGMRVDIDVERAWDLTRGSGTLRVGIIDDGVDIYHGNTGGDLVGSPWAGSMSYDLVPDPNNPAQGPDNPCCNDFHGTAVAGIIAGAHNNSVGVAGIAPNVVLSLVRSIRSWTPFDQSNTALATPHQLADGINWLWRYANSAVINASMGGDAEDDAMRTAVTNATTLGRGGRGTVVVFSAGNTAARSAGTTGRVLFPARLSATTATISVGAINRYGAPTDYTPDGTSSAPIDVVAPSGNLVGPCVNIGGTSNAGFDVVTLDPRGTRGCSDGPGGAVDYSSTFSGTSAAAPQVAGVAALLLSREPGLTAAQVKSRIRAGANPWGSSATFGAGKLNAYRALVPGA